MNSLVNCQISCGPPERISYLVRVSEIGRYFFCLLLCDRACPVHPSAFFLSWVLLLGSGKLLSIKKKCHCRFVMMCVVFTTNCQNKSRSKSLPVVSARHSPVDYLHATTHTVALAGTCTSLILFTMKFTSRHARSYWRTQSGIIQRLAQTQARKMTSKFPLSSNLTVSWVLI